MRRGHARRPRSAAKLGLTLLVVGVLGTVVGFATFAAFSSTTVNTGNLFTAGTVLLGDNGTGSAMYNVTNQKPGVDTVKCIKVTYTGTLDANVRLYTTTTSPPASSQYINLKIEKGTSDTSTFPNCGTYTSESTIFDSTVQSFINTKNSYANGIAVLPGAATKWVNNDSLVFRFTVSVQDNPDAEGATSGTHQFTWEAQNQ